LAAGAYFTPAILARSGIGPAADVRALGRPVVADLPVGERLLDHVGTGLAFEPSEALHAGMAEHVAGGRLCEPHAMVKHASSSCLPGSFDLHVLSWVEASAEPGRYAASMGVFLVAPRSHGRVRILSAEPAALPLVERGHLSCEDDLGPLVEGLELARRLAATEPLRRLPASELRPGSIPLP